MIAATALFGAASGVAHAADKSKPIDLTVRSEASSLPSTGMRSLKWDARKGRWGVTLNMDQTEVDRGPKKIGAEESQPRVRLESSFKF